MTKVKNNKGITLIALVITIIVLLILAGVTIAMLTGENGILTKATTARERTVAADEREKVGLAYNDVVANKLDGTSTGDITVVEMEQALQRQGLDSTKVNVEGVTGQDKIKITFTDTNNEYEVNTKVTGGTTTDAPDPAPSAPTYTAYAIGDEVTVSGEPFYVLEASGTSQSDVTLLAKYNLNQAGTAQAADATYSSTACAFSSDNYWAKGTPSAWSSYTDWSTEKLDISTVSGEVSGDAIYKAKQYATTVGGSTAEGRLLKYEEADRLKTSYSDMIWGTANANDGGNFLYYWLGSANELGDGSVWYVGGGYHDFYMNYCSNGDDPGVRPVITISKSNLSN